jgi:hypothetical protein
MYRDGEARQQTIQAYSLPDTTDGHDLCTYPYEVASNDWTYLVLSVAAMLHQDITALRCRGERSSLEI